jgi:diadenosine tetraphosphate (Ap4A) HIT family hydrolase
VTCDARALTIAAVAEYGDCLSCAFERRPDPSPRERVYLDASWRVAHAFGTAQPGWLVVLPRRHVLALDELTRAEAAALGPLLRAVTGCAKTYVALFAEAEGFAHVHFHVVPRPAGLDPQLRGPGIFALLGGDPARHVPDSDMDRLAGQLTAALSRAR